MRTARVVGLSPDGKSLVVATQSGEELAVAVDEALRAAMRGDRPRLGQLEIEMESSLTPREIQTRIRSGETLEDVARVAGLPMDRVERFAAPVLAEREHVAAVAMTSSVRRRGETSGHRNLRVAVTERLIARGVDVDSLTWDAYRREDGRWTVTAGYLSGDAQHTAAFLFDQQGRFSVAADDEARWLLGEQSAARGPQPGRRRPGPGGEDAEDSEPTLDLSDELALVRVVQEEPQPPLAAVRPLRPQAVSRSEPDGLAAEGEAEDLSTFDAGDVANPGAVAATDTAIGVAAFDTGEVTPGVREASTAGAASASQGADVEPDEDRSAAGGGSQLDTLYEMLGGIGYAEDSSQPYAGLDDVASRSVEPTTAEPATAQSVELEEAHSDAPADGEPAVSGVSNKRSAPGSDAIAVPDVSNAGWEPAIVVDYPIEPSQRDELEPPLDGTGRPEPPVAIEDREDEAEELMEEMEAATAAGTVSSEAGAAEQTVGTVTPASEAAEDRGRAVAPAAGSAGGSAGTETASEAVGTATGEPEATKPLARRKRASVPSWDEIMFGGPKRG